MAFSSLSLVNFRSYHKHSFSFHPQLNLVIGPNGAGKTNLLEALYVVANAKSFRAKDIELVHQGAAGYRLDGETTAKVGVRFESAGRRKRLLVSGRSAKPESFIGRTQTVLFEPGSLGIVTGAPDERRRFLDSVLSGLDPRYLKALVSYRRVLKQRNSLLRSQPLAAAEQQIFAWDINLVELAAYLYESRQQFVDFIGSTLSTQYAQLAGKPIKLQLAYKSATPAKDYSGRLLAQLNQGLRRDHLLGHTGYGPHRDDLEITMGTKPAAVVASRGEARTIVLALKLLERQYVESTAKHRPIMLLDDVFSELDARRRGLLLRQLAGHQIFLSATGLTNLKSSLPKGHAIIELKRTDARRRKIIS